MADTIEKREHPRIPVRWPITIITDKSTIEGESRNITVAGIFVHCKEELHKDEVYQMIIRIPKKETLLVKGKVVWSNFDSMDFNSSYVGMGFCFIKISDEDRQLLGEVISRYTKSQNKEVGRPPEAHTKD